jgi:hypothetical protein
VAEMATRGLRTRGGGVLRSAKREEYLSLYIFSPYFFSSLSSLHIFLNSDIDIYKGGFIFLLVFFRQEVLMLSLFDEIFGPLEPRRRPSHLKEVDGGQELKLILPGWGKEDISVSIDSGFLVVKKEGEFSRTYSISPRADPEKVSAEMKRD